MRRIRGRRHAGHRQSKTRKTRWGYNLFQGSGTFKVGLDNFTYASAWAKWPADRIRTVEDDLLEPSEETLVRTIMKLGVVNETNNAQVTAVMGLIAFDGGREPEFYNEAFFDETSLVAPPHPVFDATDDWILRWPNEFVVVSGFSTLTSAEASALWSESRAMRKLPPGMGILAVFGATSGLGDPGTQTFRWSADIRMAIRSGYNRG